MLSKYLHKADTMTLSNRINLKQNTLSLTTTGTSGAATLVGSTLNVPQYSGTTYTGGNGIIVSGSTIYADTTKLATTHTAQTINGTKTFASNLLFTDNTYDIGASGATRPRTGYFGTSLFSPLVVGGTAAGSGITFKSTTGTGTTTGDAHTFSGGTNGGTELLRITNDKRFSLNNTTLSTWTNHSGVFEGGGASIFFGQINDINFSSNAFLNTDWKYKATGKAVNQFIYDGDYFIRYAASGSAGAALTWLPAITVDDGYTTIKYNGTGASLDLQNTNASGYSGIQYLNNSGSVGTFTGFYNLTNEFRFNNIAASGFIDFQINSSSALRVNNNKTITLANAPIASANFGLANFGSGAFDGATSGFFTGSAAGTLIAGNLASGSTGDLLNLETAGISGIKVTSGGNTTIAGTLTVALAKNVTITEGSSGRAGQTTLVAGTKAITVTGITTNSRAFVTLVAQGGTSTAVYQYQAVCTANTLTISAVSVVGALINTDTSILNYFIIN